ncbi:MAG: hypothetical protein RR922_05535 [Clostridia bacterium]
MNIYNINYDQSNNKFTADITFNNINYLTQFDYILDFGYFSKIPMNPDCIIGFKDGGAILDVYPVGQISKSVINYLDYAAQKTRNILVAVDVRTYLENLELVTESKAPLILLHADTNPIIQIKGRPNFIAKIYEVPYGEKIKFKAKGKTVYIIDNTSNSPSFINIGQ